MGGRKRDMTMVRFGAKGHPVQVAEWKARAARQGKGRLYEDGSFVPKPPPPPKKRRRC